jgi:hypothetical protein
MELAMKFTKATRQKAKLRLAVTGPSGSGKTWGALLLATGLGGRIAVVDTERESASLYSHLTDFDTLNLGSPFTPERYIEAIKAAEEAGYDTCIIDSITHEWSGVGGCLELVDQIARAKYKGNSWSAWNDVTPRHRALLDAILHSSMHIIVTLRSKTETAQTEENGRKKVVKLGMKAEQRDGFEYEMTVVLDLIHDGNFATATKDRTGLFSNANPAPITVDTGKQLKQWLEMGAEPARFDEDTMTSLTGAIVDADSLETLQRHFATAYKYAKGFGNTDAMAAAQSVYNGRKAEFEANVETAK